MGSTGVDGFYKPFTREAHLLYPRDSLALSLWFPRLAYVH